MSGTWAANTAAAERPSRPGHLDVEQGHIGPVLGRRLDDLVATADGGDDLEVVFELQQGTEGGAHQLLVVGEEQADRHGPAVGSAVERDPEPPAAGLGRARIERAARRGDTFLEPGQAVAAAGGPADAVVADLHRPTAKGSRCRRWRGRGGRRW